MAISPWYRHFTLGYDMDIKQLKEEIELLERDLCIMVNARIGSFEAKTDIGIKYIAIYMSDITTIRDVSAKYIVNNVKCMVDF